ncbi:HAD family hydrolase [Demequina sp.]|uniref:HAD family hydrolase n=1 Tax=Demequina sp. TaxID=2050685 RepID=UPI003D0FAF91
MNSPASGTQVAAFFDVDNTIIRGASAYHLARGLREHDYLRTRDIFKFAFEQLKYRMFGETQQQMDAVTSQAPKFFRGWSAAEIVAIGEEVWDTVLTHRIFPGTKALIDSHLERGHEVWLVTASPQEIARLIASRIGATGGLGTVAEQEQGHYTGVIEGGLLHGPRKAEAIQALAVERGLDLSRSYAYGDSSNDVPMLEAVGVPGAINPDSRMRRIAAERNWPIREFRKRRKSGRRGVIRASVTGTAWVILAVGRGMRKAIFRR